MNVLKFTRGILYVFGGFIAASILIITSLSVYYYNAVLSSIFVLTQKEVDQELTKTHPFLPSIKGYPLMEGDILLRRHVTKKTRVAEEITHSYFTHSAVYYGKEKIIEAVGTESDPKNEIIVHDFIQSDWVKEPLERWVILRPQRVERDRLAYALEEIKKIADDPNYRFGVDWLRTENKKVTSCAELIFKEYQRENIISDTNTPTLIGPDYLFWYGVNHPDQFMIAGHN